MGYIFTLFAIIGTIMNSMQKKACFLFWLLSNIYYIAVNLLNKDYPQTLLFIFNSIVAVVGYFAWLKKEKQEVRSVSV